MSFRHEQLNASNPRNHGLDKPRSDSHSPLQYTMQTIEQKQAVFFFPKESLVLVMVLPRSRYTNTYNTKIHIKYI